MKKDNQDAGKRCGRRPQGARMGGTACREASAVKRLKAEGKIKDQMDSLLFSRALW